MRDETFSGSSRTGGHDPSYDKGVATSNDNQGGTMSDEQLRGKAAMGVEGRSSRQGTFTRRPRNLPVAQEPMLSRAKELAPTHAPQGVGGRKRGSKQVWVPIPVQVVGEKGLSNDGKRQRKNSVFDRMEVENGGDEGLAAAGSVFNRLEDPMVGRGEGHGSSVFQRLETQSADPASRGRRDQ
jgi:hypothetical protein